MKFLIAVVVSLLLVGGGLVGAWYFGLLDAFLASDEAVTGEQEAIPAVVVDKRPNLFHSLPALTVSSLYHGSLRYLQVKVAVMTRDEKTVELLESNAPRIQDALIMLLSSFDMEFLAEADGKEALRARAEERVREVILEGEIESVLFTGFIIQ